MKLPSIFTPSWMVSVLAVSCRECQWNVNRWNLKLANTWAFMVVYTVLSVGYYSSCMKSTFQLFWLFHSLLFSWTIFYACAHWVQAITTFLLHLNFPATPYIARPLHAIVLFFLRCCWGHTISHTSICIGIPSPRHTKSPPLMMSEYLCILFCPRSWLSKPYLL